MAFDFSIFVTMIYDGIEGRFGDLPRGRDDAPHDVLLNFFRLLPSKEQRIFSDAVAEVLDHVQPYEENAYKFVTLLFLVQIAKSSRSQAKVRKLLSDHVLEKYTAEQISLKTHLVTTAAKYGVDDWLRDFIFLNAGRGSDLEYSLNCLRILSWRLDSTCPDFLLLITPLFSGAYTRMLARTLEDCLDRLGGRLFLEWMHEHLDQIEGSHAPQAKLLLQSLLAACRSFPEDQYAQVIVMELESRQQAITAQKLVETAAMPPLVQESHVERALMRVRRSQLNEWELIPKGDMMSRIYYNPNGPVLLCGRTNVPLDRATQAHIIARLDRSLVMSQKEKMPLEFGVKNIA